MVRPLAVTDTYACPARAPAPRTRLAAARAIRACALAELARGLAALLLVATHHPAGAVKQGPVRTEPVDLVVIHSTGGPTCDARTGRPLWVGAGTMDDNLRRIEAHPRLGIHYMIDRDGTLRASVPEAQVAHHVFRFSLRSVAVELINDGDGRDPFPEPQIAALVTLLREIAERHGLARGQVKRHSDLDLARMPCAPEHRRKVDPGDAYPHERVLDRVFGAAPGAAAGSPAWPVSTTAPASANVPPAGSLPASAPASAPATPPVSPARPASAAAS